MLNLSEIENENVKVNVQLAPLIDIVFLTLVFFMTISAFQQMEAEINISVPKAVDAKEATRSPGEIIINITKKGNVIVNQKKYVQKDLIVMLQKVSTLFPDQPIIIRADEDTAHKYVIRVLDACSSADIWNISFATQTSEQ